MSITQLDENTTESPEGTEPAHDDSNGSPLKEPASDGAATKQRAGMELRVSLSIRAVALIVLVGGLVAGLGILSWLYVGANSKVDAQAQETRDNVHAEQVALDYAVNAAVMDYKDLGPWKKALVEDTTPELNKKLSNAANAMEQILLPLQWSSTAKPLAAKIRSHTNGVYVVDAFVSVMTKTVQAPDSLQSTATYSVTVDAVNGWMITDVGGISQVVGEK